MKRSQRALKVLIAGFGSAGRRHFRNLQALGVTDIAFYRSSRSTLSTDEIKGYPTFADLDAALAWTPSAVVIANPTSLHMPVALAAARAGIDALVEKPLSHSLDGCDELCRLSRELALIVMVGCQYRFHPLLLSMRMRLAAGEYGRPLTARAEYGDSILLWHPWEDYRDSYSAQAALGGGAILTLVHPLDYVYWLFGRVRGLHASAHKAAYLATSVDDDAADLTIDFESGVVAQVHVDFVQDPPVHTLDVLCERGRVRLDFLGGSLAWWPRGCVAPTVERAPDGHDRNAMFVDEMAHFIECVRTRRSPAIPLADGIAVLQLALNAKHDAALRSR